MLKYDEHREGQGATPTNAARARKGLEVLDFYTENGDREEALVDLLADLHHTVSEVFPGQGFLGFVGKAANHFVAEVEEEARIATS